MNFKSITKKRRNTRAELVGKYVKDFESGNVRKIVHEI